MNQIPLGYQFQSQAQQPQQPQQTQAPWGQQQPQQTQAPWGQQQQQPQQTQAPLGQQQVSYGELGLPDGDAIRQATDGIPFFPRLLGRSLVTLLGVFRRTGWKGGDQWRIRVRIDQTEMRGIPPGYVCEIYRPTGTKPDHQQFTAKMLAQFCAAVYRCSVEDPSFNWQSKIRELLEASHTGPLNLPFIINSVQGKPKNDGSGESWTNLQFSSVS